MTKAVDLAKTGSLVNSSGQIDLTTGVTGVLPVANGGTGSSSGVSPGGSTTQVQYNNAGAFAGDSGFVYSSGNVGIGTSSPDAKLRVKAGSNTLQARFSGVDSRGLAISTFASAGTADNGVTYNAGLDPDAQQVWQCGSTERMRIDSSGNVGIGTASPASQLEVKSAAFTDSIVTINATSTNVSQRLNFTANGATQTQIYDDSTITRLNAVTSKPLAFSTANTERMRIDSSGNVGIGTSPSAWTSPDFRGLQVGSGVAVYGRGSGDADRGGVSTNAYNDGAWKYIATGNATRAEQTDGSHIWYTASSGTAGNSITFTSAMELDSSSNLKFNSGYGSVATAYGCRAWVNFTGSNGSVNASGNISSVSDNGAGDYTLNFSNAMPDANYSLGFMCKPTTGQTGLQYGRVAAIRYDTSPTTAAVRIVTATTGVGLEDFDKVTVEIFR